MALAILFIASALTITVAIIRIRPLMATFEVGSRIVQDDMALFARRRYGRAVSGFLLAGTCMCCASGCLSLGGRTTYVQTSPETEARIRGLETRVGALEQAFATRSVPSVQHGAGEAIIGRSNSGPTPYWPADQTGGRSDIR